MKIALINHHFLEHDGQGRVNLELAKFLGRNGHEVHLFGHKVDQELKNSPGIVAHILCSPVERPNLIKGMFFLGAVGCLLRGFHFDIIHSNGGVMSGHHHVNTVHFVHSWWRRSRFGAAREGAYLRFSTWLNSWLEKKALSRAHTIVAVSEKVRRELISYAGVPREKIKVIYNGVATGEFDPAQKKLSREKILPELNIPLNKFVILFAGDLRNDRKGLGSLLEALPALTVDYHLIVLGSLEGSPFVEKAAQISVDDKISWAGFRKDINEFIQAADVFVYPTRTDSFPSVVMENLAGGTPVILSSSTYCGSSEIIRDGKDGLMLKNPWDKAEIAAKINLIAADRSLWSELSRNGRKLALSRSWKRMAAAYEQLYLSILTRLQAGELL